MIININRVSDNFKTAYIEYTGIVQNYKKNCLFQMISSLHEN